jgi:hypothetical protein
MNWTGMSTTANEAGLSAVIEERRSKRPLESLLQNSAAVVADG